MSSTTEVTTLVIPKTFPAAPSILFTLETFWKLLENAATYARAALVAALPITILSAAAPLIARND
ncbi:hypothetical protein OC25_15270 [Pedobacter kyungheensis]|uniref:Uncharacterized protein n=1 Tax=Pedobacter kyungheensis TaxID=1069985 RepID=A0A0C1FXY7_9SPHI|nr:hypothetical protein OC25_15270 [Pedobacter kyungheensis]